MSLTIKGLAATLFIPAPLSLFANTGSNKHRIKAIAFDAFPVFDPRPVFKLAEELFPGKGTELTNAWRTRQFEYTWLRSMSNQYKDFWQVTSDALIFAAKILKLDLSEDKKDQLMNAYLSLKTWPDVLPALSALKDAGFRLGFLSNFTSAMLHSSIKTAGVENIFEQVLSTDQVKTYKPDPHAYQMAVDGFKLKREEILFVAFAGWDAAGAKAYGYETYWVNRMNLPAEELGTTADGIGSTLTGLVNYLEP